MTMMASSHLGGGKWFCKQPLYPYSLEVEQLGDRADFLCLLSRWIVWASSSYDENE